MLTLTNGVVLAYYDSAGIWLQDGSALLSQGTPNVPNLLAYYALAQEQPILLWNVTNAVAQSQAIYPSTNGVGPNPAIGLRFTSLHGAPGAAFLLNTADTGQVLGSLDLRDCEIYGAGAAWQMNETNNAPLVRLVNNLFDRTPFAIARAAQVTTANNLFSAPTNHGGNVTAISIQYGGGTSPNSHFNITFDGCAAALDGSIGYNAYLNGATNTAYQTTDFQTDMTWQTGTLGSYYQPTNSPHINAGRTTADQFGLQDYTVTTNNVPGRGRFLALLQL